MGWSHEYLYVERISIAGSTLKRLRLRGNGINIAFIKEEDNGENHQKKQLLAMSLRHRLDAQVKFKTYLQTRI
jgi:hypothetical protein